MDWFKKLIHVFKDRNTQNDRSLEYIQEHSGKSSKTKITPKDLNAKISYQYPKGSFRFPLIPDDVKPIENSPIKNVNKEQENRRNREWENKSARGQLRENVSKEPPLNDLMNDKIRESSQGVRVPIQKRQEARPLRKELDPPQAAAQQKTKKEIKRHGPFRPTIIPSPIYGYERPKRTAVIEHELSGFLHEDTDKKVNQPFSQSESATDVIKEQEAAAYNEMSSGQIEVIQEPEIPQTQNDENENALELIQVEEYDDNVSELDKIASPITDIDKLEETGELHITDIDKLEETGELHITDIDKLEKTDGLHNIDIDKREEPDELHIIDIDKLEEPDEIHNTDMDKLEEPDEIHNTDIDKLEKTEDDPIAELDTSLEFDDNTIPDKPQSEQETETAEMTGIQAEPEERPKRRSHIPFNVLMLKQDRQKIEHRKLEQTNIGDQKSNGKQQIALEFEDEPVPEKIEEKDEANFQETYSGDFEFPDENLLLPPVIQEASEEWLQGQEELLNRTLTDFNVGAKVVNVTQGPSVTRFEVQPDPGVKVNKITNLADDIKLSLAAKDIRIEAPIPGKHTIGIEVPNSSSRPVLISEILFSPQFRDHSSPLTAALGLDISGTPIVTDLRKMPHGLIAGATGSGKSVCINSILISLLYKADPNDVKLMLIDPKMVELAPYNHIPHLVSPVITDVKAATAALKWAVEEMERRYELFAHTGVRDISRFNELAEGAKQYSDKLPYILIVIDELADLMMVAPADVEEAVCRIAQKARACGIHLIIATQRPSVDVITGLIKANIPTRIAFSVSSQIDSRTIIDISGAEKLLGRGDMLFLENGTSKPVRLQGTFITDIEIDKVVEHVRSQGEPEYLFEQTELLKKAQVQEEEDELFHEACEFVVEQGGASTSSLQRRFKIGYNRAARLIDMMEQNGFISEARGSKPRDILITVEELDSFNGSSTIN